MLYDSDEVNVFTPPKYDWKCELIKKRYQYLEEGCQPNAFHRFMQKLCFGFKWTKIEMEKNNE